MKVINVSFYIKETKRNEFLKAMVPLIASARQEKGCQRYDLYENIEQKNNFSMIEHWESQEDIEQHNQNSLLLTFFERLSDYSEKKAKITVFDKGE